MFFCKGRSCEAQLALAVDDHTKILDSSSQPDDILCTMYLIMDFKKVFGLVPHQRLLHKVIQIGIAGPLHTDLAYLGNSKYGVLVNTVRLKNSERTSPTVEKLSLYLIELIVTQVHVHVPCKTLTIMGVRPGKTALDQNKRKALACEL